MKPTESQIKEAIEQLLDCLQHSDTVSVVGRTAVGKTALLQTVVDQAQLPSSVRQAAEEQRLPLVWLTIRPHRDAPMTAPGLLTDLLRVVEGAPCMKATECSADDPTPRGLTKSALQDRLVRQLRSRGTMVVVIDEAQTPVQDKHAPNTDDRLELYRSLCNLTDTKVVVCGPESSPPVLANPSHPTVDAELVAFLYDGSRVSVKRLKGWLADAKRLASEEAATTGPAVLTLEHLRRTNAPEVLDADGSKLLDTDLDEPETAT